MKKSLPNYDWIQRKYNLSPPQYDYLRKRSNYCCDICACNLPESKKKIDHDHSTGEVRGILCNGCNTSLGKLGDDIPSILRVLDYLRNDITLTPEFQHLETLSDINTLLLLDTSAPPPSCSLRKYKHCLIVDKQSHINRKKLGKKDPHNYYFSNSSISFYGTRSDFRRIHSVDKYSVRAIIKGTSQKRKGWYVLWKYSYPFNLCSIFENTTVQ